MSKPSFKSSSLLSQSQLAAKPSSKWKKRTDTKKLPKNIEKQKNRLDYFRKHDMGNFRKLMADLKCGYTGFMFPTERFNSEKFQRYFRFETQTRDKREKQLKQAYVEMNQGEILMKRSKFGLKQYINQLANQKSVWQHNPELKKTERDFRKKLWNFLNVNQCKTVNQALNIMFNSSNMIDDLTKFNEEIKKWMTIQMKQNEKQSIPAENLLKTGRLHNDLVIRFQIWNRIIQNGTETQASQARCERINNCIALKQYRLAAKDLTWLLSRPSFGSIRDPNKLAALLYEGAQCFYALTMDLKSSVMERKRNFIKFKMTIDQLKMMAYLDFGRTSQKAKNWNVDQIISPKLSPKNSDKTRRKQKSLGRRLNIFNLVLRELLKEGIPLLSKQLVRLEEKIRGKKWPESSSREDDVTLVVPSIEEKDLMYSDVFDNCEWQENGIYLLAKQAIPKDRIVFREKVISLSTRIPHLNKYCSFCSQRLQWIFHPCSRCSESVFCDAICETMSMMGGHSRTCKLSPDIIQELFNDNVPSMVYDFFANLPIRMVIDVSRVDKLRAYNHVLKYPKKLSFKLAMFCSLMLTLPVGVFGQLKVEQDFSRRIFFNSIYLANIISLKFDLKRLDLRIIADHLDAKTETDNLPATIQDLRRLILVVFATMYQLKHSPFSYNNLFIKTNESTNQPTTLETVGHGFGGFDNRIRPCCLTESNVIRRFQKNGEIIYRSLVDIPEKAELKVYNEIPECGGQQREQWFKRFNLQSCGQCKWCKKIITQRSIESLASLKSKENMKK